MPSPRSTRSATDTALSAKWFALSTNAFTPSAMRLASSANSRAISDASTALVTTMPISGLETNLLTVLATWRRSSIQSVGVTPWKSVVSRSSDSPSPSSSRRYVPPSIERLQTVAL